MAHSRAMSTSTPLRARLRLHLLPQTSLGWTAVRLTIAAVALMGVMGAFGVTFGFNPLLNIFVFPALLSAVGAGIAGVVATVRRGERGLIVFAPLLAGLVVVFFLVGEFAVPH